MAGIYVHIPFCKVKCHYCDFHFSTNLSLREKMVDAICAELVLRKDYLSSEVNTIYFGGGTPSILEASLLNKILDCINGNFEVKKQVELTFECNPDDLTPTKLEELKAIGVNRLSIGVQSFNQDVLEEMNRAHNSQEAEACIQLAQEAGISNITADLIYGIPGKDLDYWKAQVEKMIELGVPHISAYCLTIEPNTVFGNRHTKGELHPLTDEDQIAQFQYLMDRLKEAGYEHYEISNFAKEGFISRHNSAYWLGEEYLGVGPSAHSYNGKERSWNIRNNHQYVKKLKEGSEVNEFEVLTPEDMFHDYVLTRLRTKWGLAQEDLDRLGRELNLQQFQIELNKHQALGNIEKRNGVITLTDQGKYIADQIASDLFV